MFQQVPDGPFPSMTIRRFVKESAPPGPFRDILALYAQANLLQIMQSTACNALHGVKQRCCRIRVLKRKKVEQTACECYEVIRAHFRRLGL